MREQDARGVQIVVDGQALTKDEAALYKLKYRTAAIRGEYEPEKSAVEAVRRLRTFGKDGFNFKVGDKVAVERDGIVTSGQIVETITTKGGRQAGIVKFEDGACADLGTADTLPELGHQVAAAVTK